MTTLTRADIGRLLTVRNESGGQFIGVLKSFNSSGNVFMEISAVNLGKCWERLAKTETRLVIGAEEVKDG